MFGRYLEPLNGARMKTETRFGEEVIRHRWCIILATLLMVTSAGYGSKNLGFTNNYRHYS